MSLKFFLTISTQHLLDFREASDFQIYTLSLALFLSSFLCHSGFNLDFFCRFEFKATEPKKPANPAYLPCVCI